MKNIARTLVSVLVLTYTASALAQASCNGDGIPQPVAIFERFISADCEACWTDAATPRALCHGRRGGAGLDRAGQGR